jgi:hypothetical protein
MELGLTENDCVLHLSPFSLNAKLGGAIRSEELFKVIKTLYPKSEVLHVNQTVAELNPDAPEWVRHDHPQLSDILMLFKDFCSQDHIVNVPDAIIFDHPWLWTEAKKLKEVFPKVKLIHSSHNIEFLTKSELLKGLDQDAKIEAVKYVRSVEEEIARECDLVLCVTELDKLWFQNNGAKNVIDANNGTISVQIPIEEYERFMSISSEVSKHRLDDAVGKPDGENEQQVLGLAS